MMELAQLFQDLETLVVQQEPAVTQIEQTAIVLTDNIGKGNTELDGAVKKAKAARRKKWICAGIIGMLQSIGLRIIRANLGSRDSHRRHRHCPRSLGCQWYAIRDSSLDGYGETWLSKARFFWKAPLIFTVTSFKKTEQATV